MSRTDLEVLRDGLLLIVLYPIGRLLDLILPRTQNRRHK